MRTVKEPIIYLEDLDWFSNNISTWEGILAKFKGLPNLQFIEIGVWEGRSSLWLLNNILTHKTSKLTCIDLFDQLNVDELTIEKFTEERVRKVHANFKKNIANYPGKVNVIAGASQEKLRKLPLYAFDCVYIDGSHTASDTLEDAILAFRLIKKGGIIIFDDYLWGANLDTLNVPKPGIDAFLQIFQDQYKLLHKDYQVIIERL